MTWRTARCIGTTLALAAALAAQQPGSIRGVVHDRDLAAPLSEVSVRIVETGSEMKTSAQGHFTFTQVQPGNYTLLFAREGYVRQVKTDVTVAAGALTELDVALAGDITEMEEFVVPDALRLDGSEDSLLRLRLQSATVMDSIGKDLMSRAGASDAAGALRLVAGASVQDDGSAVIRGLPDRYVSSQLNGVRLPSADEDKRAVELDQFPASVIDSIQVSKTFAPDQQGDASGGAVDVRLRGVPRGPFLFQFKGETSYNTQTTGRGRFLTYQGGGVHGWGKDGGGRRIQYENLGRSWTGAVGTTTAEAPVDGKWSATLGGSQDVGGSVRLGALATFFYERDSSFFDHGVDDSYWVESPGAPMTPKTHQGTVKEGDFKTALFDVTQGRQSVQWGGLTTFGVESERHALSLTYLYTRTAEDSATLAEDTRGKQYFFPGHERDDPTTPGHDQPDAAPYLRLETLEYTERTTESLQLHGRHTLPIERLGIFRAPELDWTVARSSADLRQPDKRQFGSLWVPGRQVGSIVVPPGHRPYKPSANFTLGNLQRIWKEVAEDSELYGAGLKLPFGEAPEEAGALRFGVFQDRVDRSFDQDTFSNFNDNSSFAGDWRRRWSEAFPYENHPIQESLFDVDYEGKQEIGAWYAMLEVPLFWSLTAIGGVRREETEIGIVNDPEENATWFPPGSLTQTRLNPGDADVAYERAETLPSFALVWRGIDQVTVRASYNETVARQTFKELTPILQQEYLGGPIFIGNPELELATLKNYDLRVDYTPYPGGLLSASWFEKDVTDAIEYVQRVATFDFTTAVNYPKGELRGFELETRHALGELWEPLTGLTLGANATFLGSQVTLPADEAAGFDLPSIRAPMRSRDMTNAPEHLYNFFVTWDIPRTGTELAAFYTLQGGALVAGAAQSNGNFVPSVYADDFATLNVSLTQRLGKYTRLQVQAKNLTDPTIREVYRSPYIGDDVTKTSFTRGIDYTLSLGAEIRF